MTEAEWLACENPARMLYVVQGPEPEYGGFPTRKISDRKLRLFACGCCRLWPSPGVGEYNDVALEALIERGAAERDYLALDSLLGGDGVQWAAHQPRRVPECRAEMAALLRDIVGNPFRPVTLPKSANPCERCGGRGYTPRDPAVSWSYGALTEAERQRCGRCLGTGRTEGPCPWLTPAVLSLARAAYEDRPGRDCFQPCPNCFDAPDARWCGLCGLVGGKGGRRIRCSGGRGGRYRNRDCPHCRGAGRIDDGTLDPFRLALLADALEEAGCTDDSQGRRTKVEVARERTHAVMGGCCDRFADFKACGCWEEAADEGLLAHLRGPGPHARGCWVVDCILGKS